jgi:Fur family ferric uptake transcriptional regulator
VNRSTDPDWAEHAAAELKAAGHRAGGARKVVIDLLADQHCCLTAQQIYDRLRERGSVVGIASVYRALDLFTNLRLVHRIDIGPAAYFEPNNPGGDHHHHVVCEQCGGVSAFEDPSLERSIDRVAKSMSHSVSGHDVVLRGTCADCEDAG